MLNIILLKIIIFLFLFLILKPICLFCILILPVLIVFFYINFLQSYELFKIDAQKPALIIFCWPIFVIKETYKMILSKLSNFYKIIPLTHSYFDGNFLIRRLMC